MPFILINERSAEYLATVRAKADALGLREKLEAQLTRLENYGNHGDEAKNRCVLYPDFSPLSFGFNIEHQRDDGSWKHWFNGGLIFHGQHDRGGDGSSPTFSVSLTPVDDDWSIHT